jgi:hypothetical protein
MVFRSIAKTYNLNPNDFLLKDTDFDFQSSLHGANHIYRVMVHTLLIGINEKLIRESKLAFYAAYIHDLARKHDGICLTHGEESTKHKLPLFSEFFLSNGVSKNELKSIATAITFHSKSSEIDKSNSDYIYTAILKDGDALDRVRLGDDELNEKNLRLPQTKELIFFAYCFFDKTPKEGFTSFAEALYLAEEMLKTKNFTFNATL